LKELIILH